MLNRTSAGEPLANAAGTSHKRHLPFSGARNFRDLGGYSAIDGRTVRWGVLFRSGALHKLSDHDLEYLKSLNLERIIDFRSALEREQRPNRLPSGLNLRVVEIPILDTSTKVWHETREEMLKKVRDVDPEVYMAATNTEFVTTFTPEMRRFVHEVLTADGRPLLFHCAAGKDRTGFGAAILLKMMGVPHETVMEDYLLTNHYLLAAYKWKLFLLQFVKGRRFASAIRGFVDARETYLSAAFEAIDREYGSFENYVRDGLGLSAGDVERMKAAYLE